MIFQRSILEYEPESKDLFVNNDSEISFDTFFNSFNVFLIKHYTDVNEIEFVANYENGQCKLVYENQQTKIVLGENILKNTLFKVDLRKLPENGVIYPIFSKNSSIKTFCFNVDDKFIRNKVNVCGVFCTFKREKFIYHNFDLLSKTSCNLSHLIIVDNACSLKDSITSDFATVIPNKNLGGSGGFTRGMLEAKAMGFSHILLMDDDITLLPSVIDKAINLLSLLKDSNASDWIGFSMFANDKPTVQFELGCQWTGVKMHINNHNLSLSEKDNLFKNQINNKYNYSAWWSLLMPTKVIEKYGCPLPFFIKFDDIEYGLRRRDENIILTNGFGVWHENFDNKYNPYLEYYLYRNALVTNCLHFKNSFLKSVVRFFGKNVKFYFKGQFVQIRLLDFAINDFLRGSKFFIELDIEKKNKEIREQANLKIFFLKGIVIIPFISIFHFIKLSIFFRKTKSDFKNNIGKLTSEEYWKQQF